jgi:cell division septation protein DedD
MAVGAATARAVERPESDDVLDLPRLVQGGGAPGESEPVFADLFSPAEEESPADWPAARRSPAQPVLAPGESYAFLPSFPRSAFDLVGALIGGEGWRTRLLIAALILGGLTFHYFVSDLIFSRRGNEVATSSAPTTATKIADNAPAASPVPPVSAPPSPAPVKPLTRAPEAKKEVKKRAESPATGEPFVRDRGKGNLTLQVASYTDLGQANERATRLKSAGVRAHVVKATVPQRGVRYRVVAGRFTSAEEAKRYGQQLRAKGAVQDFIVTPL